MLILLLFMKNKNISYFILMHLGFLIYSFYSIVGKISSNEEFLSFKFILCYMIVFFIMGIYALIWQQVLKHIPLSFAISNKSITILWGMLFSYLLFKEQITVKSIIGAILILIGIIILSREQLDV